LAGAAATNQILWFCTNPYTGSLPRPKCKTKLLTPHTRLIYFINGFVFVSDNTATIFYYVGAAATNQVLWFNTNPFAGSLPHPNRLSKKHIFIKGYLIPHDEIGGSGQLVGKGLGGNSAVGFSHFLLIKPLGFGDVHFGKVRGFNISPC
jgi:hypothetical protein